MPEMDAPIRVPPPAGAVSYPAFECGARVFTLDDVLVAARCLGGWADFASAWRERAAAGRAAAAAGLAPEQAGIDGAIEAFRYARDLVSGEECDRWLEKRGLGFADLEGCIVRRLQAELAEGETAPVSEPEDNDGSDTGETLRADALLADEFNDWARQLARRLAAAVEAGRWPVEPASLAGRWTELEAGYSAVAAGLVTPARRRQALADHRLALTRVTFELAEFDSAGAAREAVLCAREDGATLGETAGANAFPCRTVECFLGDLPAAWAEVLTSARVGEAVIPPAEGGSLAVVALVSRREPALEDAAVCERLDGILLDRHFHEFETRHIRWLVDVELAS